MIVIAFVFLVSCFFATQYFLFRKKSLSEVSCKHLDEIPCPGAIPILGNICDMFFSYDELWKIARKRALDHYPIYRQNFFNKNNVYLMNPEDIEVIFRDTSISKKGSYYDPLRKVVASGLIVNDEESWHSRRKILKKSFDFSVISECIAIFNKEVISLVSRLQKNINEEVDLNLHVENLIFKITFANFLGNEYSITDKKAEDYIHAMKTVLEIMLLKKTKPYLNFVWPLLKAKKDEDKSLDEMNTYISKAIEENSDQYAQKNKTYFNTLDLLLGAPHLFDTEGVRDEITTFVLGSQDATSSALSFMLMALANYPEHQESVYEEIKNILINNQNPTYSDLTSMDYLDRFIKECLRLYPPFIMMERTLTKDIITKTGYRLPKGTMVLISLLDIQRNPNLFPNPEKFDPDRFLLENNIQRHPFSYIPFGAGPKICIAQKFAVLALKAIICGILQNFKLEPGTKIENIEFSRTANLGVKGGIKVNLKKR
ncbi:hypothetical protein WA026_005845 [Henosepilachna vigintioctopunctata]|uniref:Cytochrome P450 n=1 Tax=Henosepilachna vigintioctopunctata TaxID=420089 RepID=A0AAW1U562_9CUCU